MTEFETIQLATDERGVATLTLNRPEQHNALSGLMIDELLTATLRLANDDSVRLVILTGSGTSFVQAAILAGCVSRSVLRVHNVLKRRASLR